MKCKRIDDLLFICYANVHKDGFFKAYYRKQVKPVWGSCLIVSPDLFPVPVIPGRLLPSRAYFRFTGYRGYLNKKFFVN